MFNKAFFEKTNSWQVELYHDKIIDIVPRKLYLLKK